MHELRINDGELREIGLPILKQWGVPEREAATTVDSLVDCDLRGVHSHGVQRLRWYSQRLKDGGTNPTPSIKILSETASTAVVDGDNGLGQVVSDRAMRLAIDKALHSGVGIVAVRNSHHFGACAYWVERALEHDMIGIVTTNGGSILAPWAGLTPSMGTNPLGVAVPAGEEKPVIFDMATSIVAGGKLDMAISRGEPIPEGWALDKNGKPTTDPKAGREGTLLPIGDHKGYGLTLVFEVLAAVLSGAHFSRQVAAPAATDTAMKIGHYFQVIRIDSFMPVTQFKARMDELIRQMKNSERAPDHERIFIPGEIELETRERYQRDGIPLPANLLEELRQTSGLAVS
jgi:LDH2 family malate/lactate/ureidoglycolate dehydrogenase